MLPCLPRPDLYCSVSSAFPLCFLHLLQCCERLRQFCFCPVYTYHAAYQTNTKPPFIQFQSEGRGGNNDTFLCYETIYMHICKASSQRTVYWRSSGDPGKDRGIFSDDADDAKLKKKTKNKHVCFRGNGLKAFI